MLMDAVIAMKTPAFVMSVVNGGFPTRANGGFPIAPGARPVPALPPSSVRRRFACLERRRANKGGIVARRSPRETWPGRAMTIVAILAAALGVAACPVAYSASESRSHPILLAQEPLAVSPSGPVKDDRADISGISYTETLASGGFPAVSGHGGATGEHRDAVQTRAAKPPGLAALEAAILRMEGEIAELARLAEWQAQLLSAARTDPVGARRQRRTRSSCLKTPLATWCDRLNGMYRDGDGMAASGGNDKTSRRTVQ